MSNQKTTVHRDVNISESGKHKKIRISYSFRNVEQNFCHCFGVNALAIDEENGVLFSAGRDSLILSWDIRPKQVSSSEEVVIEPSFLTSYEYHNDWVNDIVLFDHSTKLLSCSSDTTVNLWNTSPSNESNTSRLVASWNWHQDYVKVVRYASEVHLAVSAGLDGLVHIWDPNISSPADSVPLRTLHTKKLSSIYSMAINSRGNMLLTGATDMTIRAYDPRTGTKQFKLTGHRDNIKTLLIHSDAITCVSGSSDGTMRVWDLRMRQCTDTYTMHADSVWALAASQDLSFVLSGGRDHRVYVTDLTTRHSLLITVEDAPLLSIVLQHSNNTLWAATTCAQIKNWKLPSLEELRRGSVALSPHTIRAVNSGPNNSDALVGTTQSSNSPLPTSPLSPLRPSQSLLSVSPPPLPMTPVTSGLLVAPSSPPSSHPLNVASTTTDSTPQHSISPTPFQSNPLVTIRGRSGIIRYHIMNNRRHVLTEDSSGNIHLWDVTSVTKKRVISKDSRSEKPFEDYIRELDEVIAIPNWFSADTKTGSLTIHLDYPQCFAAVVCYEDVGDMFHSSLSLKSDSDNKNAATNQTNKLPVDTPVNIGACVLKALFKQWVDGRGKLQNLIEHENDDDDKSESQTSETESSESSADANGDTDNKQSLKSVSTPVKTQHTSNDSSIVSSSASFSTSHSLSSSMTFSSTLSAPPLSSSLKTNISDPSHTSPSSNDTSAPSLAVLHTAQEPNFRAKGGPGTIVAVTQPPSSHSSASISTSNSNVSSKGNQTETATPTNSNEPKLVIDPQTPLILSEEGTGRTLLRTQSAHLTGREQLPTWLVECLLYDELPKPSTARRLPFVLQCVDSRLVDFEQKFSLTGDIYLVKLRKIADFLVRKLQLELPPSLPQASTSLPSLSSSQATTTPIGSSSNQHVPAECYLHFYCKDNLLTPTLTLATVRTFYWKSSDVMVLNYKINDAYASCPIRRTKK